MGAPLRLTAYRAPTYVATYSGANVVPPDYFLPHVRVRLMNNALRFGSRTSSSRSEPILSSLTLPVALRPSRSQRRCSFRNWTRSGTTNLASRSVRLTLPSFSRYSERRHSSTERFFTVSTNVLTSNHYPQSFMFTASSSKKDTPPKSV